MQHAFKIRDVEHAVGLSRSPDGYRLHLGERCLEFRLQPGEQGDLVLQCGGTVDHLRVALDGDDVWIHLDGETHCLRFEHALQRLAELNEAAGADVIKAAMPGSLVSLGVAAGDSVHKGQTLLVMESMKMETTIVAPRDGVVAEVRLAPGQTFDKDAVLLSLEPVAGE